MIHKLTNHKIEKKGGKASNDISEQIWFIFDVNIIDINLDHIPI